MFCLIRLVVIPVRQLVLRRRHPRQPQPPSLRPMQLLHPLQPPLDQHDPDRRPNPKQQVEHPPPRPPIQAQQLPDVQQHRLGRQLGCPDAPGPERVRDRDGAAGGDGRLEEELEGELEAGGVDGGGGEELRGGRGGREAGSAGGRWRRGWRRREAGWRGATHSLLADGEDAGHGVTDRSERDCEHARAPADDTAVDWPVFRHGDARAVARSERDRNVGGRERIEQWLDERGRVLRSQTRVSG